MGTEKYRLFDQNAYVILIVSVLPLIAGSSYYNILQVKFYAFAAFTLAHFIMRLCMKGRAEQVDERLLLYDVCIYVMVAVNVVSYIVNVQTNPITFLGDRYSGVLFCVLLAVEYFAISRQGFRQVALSVLGFFAGACGVFVSVIAILNHFLTDPLGLYKNTWTSGFWNYISTMGNKTVAGCYFALLLVFAFGVLVGFRQDRFRAALLYLGIFLYSMALISASSDSSVLALAAGLFFQMTYIVFSGNDKSGMFFRFFTGLCVMTVAFTLMGRLDSLYTPEGTNNIDSLSALLGCGRFAIPAAVVFLFVGMICYSMKSTSQKKLVFDDTGFCAAIALVVVACCIIGAVNNTEYPAFDENWGNGRGLIYRCVWDTYLNGTGIVQKFIGCGPDSVHYITDIWCGEELNEKLGIYLLDAHNELLHMLLTTGIIGMLSWFLFFGGVFVCALRKSRERIELMICCSLMLVSTVWGMFSSMQPFTTPLVFLVCAIAVSICSEQDT